MVELNPTISLVFPRAVLVCVWFCIYLKEHDMAESNLDLWVVFLFKITVCISLPLLSERKSLF